MKINRELLAEILQGEYEIKMAENGVRALEIIEEYHDEIAVMLLDLVMPFRQRQDALNWVWLILYIALLITDL